jgi:hypothetical protein
VFGQVSAAENTEQSMQDVQRTSNHPVLLVNEFRKRRRSTCQSTCIFGGYPGEPECVVARDGFGVTMGNVSSELVTFSSAVI